MKIFSLLVSLLVSFSAFSAQYTCVAGRSELVNFSMNVSKTQSILKFQKATNAEVAADLNKKAVTLELDIERTSEASGWKIYTGKIEVNKAMQDYRHFELSINPTTPDGSSTLKGNFSLGPRGNSLWPAYLSQYEMNCQLTK